MSNKKKLKAKFREQPYNKNLTENDLDALMSQCDCEKKSGGRGSGLRYVHTKTKRVLTFDGPHPAKELKRYQVRKVCDFLEELGYFNDDDKEQGDEP